MSRLPVRIRLTLGYAVLFAISGVIVVGTSFWLVDKRMTPHDKPQNGYVVKGLGPADKLTIEKKKLALDAKRQAVTEVEVNGVTKVIPVKDMKTADGKPLSEAEMDAARSIKRQAANQFERQLLLQSGLALGGTALVSALAGWLMAGRVLRPVRAVSATARRLSRQNLRERLPVGGPRDEMRELAETFNGMITRLERAFAAQQRFAANASHELRTPMTTQRTLLEVAAAEPDASRDLKELAPQLIEVIRRQELLVAGLLALARSDHGVERTEDVDLAALVTRAVAQVRAEAEVRGVTVSVSVRPAHTQGDPMLWDLLVGNLLRNAVRHNTPDGTVTVTVDGDSLTVENTGPDLDPERLSELVEPFRRGRRDRVGSAADGAGLGLPIVCSVARAHGAALSLWPRAGGGLIATVTLPASVMSAVTTGA
ncbi:MAG: ATP-binding protein [Mycobacteriales bacterium]